MDSSNANSTPGLDEFITFDNAAGTVTVDTTEEYLLGMNSGAGMKVYPSYRTAETVTCNDVYTSLCTTLTMPIMIYNAAQGPSTTTTTTRNGGSCVAKTEWPKVHSDAAGTTNAFIGMSVDPNQGNVMACGYSLMTTDQP